MAAPTLIQSPSVYVTGSNTSETITGTVGSWDQAVAAGSTLILVIQNSSSSDRSYGCSDDVDGTWDDFPVSKTTDLRQTKIFYKRNHTGGTVNVTVTSNFNIAKTITLVEISESWVDVYSRNQSVSVDGTNGYPSSADSTVIDTSTDVFVIAALTLTASGVISTASAPWTELYNNGTNKSVKYRTSATALTNERGYFEEAGTNRLGCAAIAAFTSNPTLAVNAIDAPNLSDALSSQNQFFALTVDPLSLSGTSGFLSSENKFPPREGDGQGKTRAYIGFQKEATIGVGQAYTDIASFISSIGSSDKGFWTVYVTGSIGPSNHDTVANDTIFYSLTITSAPGERHSGTYSTSFARIRFGNDGYLGAPGGDRQNNTIIRDIILDFSDNTNGGIGATSNRRPFYWYNSDKNLTYDPPWIHDASFNKVNRITRCIIKGPDVNVTHDLTFFGPYSEGLYDHNIITGFNAPSQSLRLCGFGYRVWWCLNNTVVNCSGGEWRTYSYATATTGNPCHHNLVANTSNFSSVNNNGSFESPSTYADNFESPSNLEFIDYSNGNYQLAGTDSGARQVTTISSPLPASMAYDIRGRFYDNTTTFDAGADQFDFSGDTFLASENQFFSASIPNANLYQNQNNFFNAELIQNLDAALYQNSQRFHLAYIPGTKLLATAFRLQTPAATGVQNYTFPSDFNGETPKAIILFGTHTTTDDTPISTSKIHLMTLDENSNGGTSIVNAQDGVSVSNVDRYYIANASQDIMSVMLDDGTFRYWRAIDIGVIQNGFTANYNQVNATPRYLQGLLLGGQAISHVKGGVTSPSYQSPLNVDLGFVPDIVIVHGIGLNMSINGDGDGSRLFHFGIVDLRSTPIERGISLADQGGTSPTNVGYHISDTSVGGQQPGSAWLTNTYLINLSAWDSYPNQGFTVNDNPSVSVSDDLFYLALKFAPDAKIKLDSFDIPTSGDISVTNTGFKPNQLIMVSSSATAYDTDTRSPLGQAYTFATATDQYTYNIHDVHNVTTSNTASESLSGFALRDENGDLAKSSSFAFDSQGFDWTLSTNPSSTYKGFYLALGDSSTVDINLQASLYQNDNNFFNADLIQNLDGTLYTNDQQYFSAELIQNLDGSLYVNESVYYGGAFPGNLQGNGYTNEQQYFNADLIQNLDGTLYTNEQQYFSADLIQNLDGTLYTNDQQYFNADLIQNLDGSLYTNEQQYFNGEIKVGKLLTGGSVYTNEQQYFSADLIQNLDGALYTNEQVFYGGAFPGNLQGNGYTNEQQYFQSEIKVEKLLQSDIVYINDNNFFTSDLIQNLDGTLYTNGQQYFNAKLIQNLDGTLYNNDNNFFNATLIQNLDHLLYTNDNNFFSANLIQNLDGSLYVNENVYYGGAFPGNLQGNGYTNEQQYFNGEIKVEKLLQSDTIYTNQNNFFDGTVSFTLLHNLYINNNNYFTNEIKVERLLQGNVLLSSNEFYQHLAFGSGQNQIVMII